jgi:LuxR family transcriptional regulator, maltose regulon positive regulatory protein
MVSVENRAEPEVLLAEPGAPGSLHARTAIPEVRASTLPRPSVEALLAEAVSHRLTLVSAGPGWGKTTVVARWARAAGRPRIAWLTLEPFDDRPAAFWSDVLMALRDAGAVPPGHPLGSLTVSGRLQPGVLRRVLAAIESLPDPVVLVLDDFHHVVGAKVAATIDDLLRYPLPLHLVLLTRADPLLDLHRLRGQGEIAEIGTAELAFDAAAVESLATSHGHPVHGAALDRLLDETGGWAVGVRLRLEAAADPLQRARADRSAAEFLLTEVLDRQTPAVRRFMLRTSVVSTLCVELAGALDPGVRADQLLPALAAADGFVTTAGENRPWYRYHPLLRQMLEAELRAEDPEALREVHRSAARWFAANDEPLRALEHAAASHDWPLVGAVFVEGAAARLVGPHRETIAAVLAQVPYATLAPSARLSLCAGALAVVDERDDAARRHLSRARALLGERPGRTADAVLLELLDASAARGRGDVRGLATAAGAALAAADSAANPFPALGVYRDVAAAHRAAGLAWCAARPEGSSELPRARPPESPGAESATTGPVLIGLGARAAAALLRVAEGRLGDGDAAARAAVADAETLGLDMHAHARAAWAAMAWVRYLRAADEGLDRQLAHALAADAGGREPASEAAVRLLQTLVAAGRGHPRSASQALMAADDALGTVETPPVLADLWLRAEAAVRLLHDEATSWPSARPDHEVLGSAAVVTVCRARELLAAGRTCAALDAVSGLVEADRGEADDLVRVEAALVEASALARGGTRRVDVPLALALDLARAEELAAPFLTVPVRELRPALARAVAARDDGLSLRLRSRLEGSTPAPEPAPLVEPLTERELAVLGALPTMESNVEIAADFFVSVNTVKAHLKSVYRKLGVSSRRDAVRRARALGLLA